MKIVVNLDDLALLLDLPERMHIESVDTEEMTMVCEVEALGYEDGTYFALYEIDDDGNVGLSELTQQA